MSEVAINDNQLNSMTEESILPKSQQESSTNKKAQKGSFICSVCQKEYSCESYLNEHLTHHQMEKEIIRQDDFSEKSNECNMIIGDNSNTSPLSSFHQNSPEIESNSEILYRQTKENSCISNVCQKTHSCENHLNVNICSNTL